MLHEKHFLGMYGEIQLKFVSGWFSIPNEESIDIRSLPYKLQSLHMQLNNANDIIPRINWHVSLDINRLGCTITATCDNADGNVIQYAFGFQRDQERTVVSVHVPVESLDSEYPAVTPALGAVLCFGSELILTCNLDSLDVTVNGELREFQLGHGDFRLTLSERYDYYNWMAHDMYSFNCNAFASNGHLRIVQPIEYAGNPRIDLRLWNPIVNDVLVEAPQNDTPVLEGELIGQVQDIEPAL